MTPERFEFIAEEIARQRYEEYIHGLLAHQSALERSLPRILGAMFGNKKPKDPPRIPSFDELKAGNFSNDNSTIDADDDNTFVTDNWWERPPEVSTASSEIQYAGELALSGLAPTSFDGLDEDDLASLDQ